MKTIIMLSGLKGTGKDTTANILKSFLPNDTLYLAFADPIKKASSIIFDIDFDILDGKTASAREERDKVDEFWSEYLGEITRREFLTKIGTDVLRKHIHNDIWIILAKKKILESTGNFVVITDLREPNEEQSIYELEDENTKVVHIRLEHSTKPSWWDIAEKAYYSHDQESIDKLKELKVHPSEWLQVGLSPDSTIINDPIIGINAERMIEQSGDFNGIKDKLKDILDFE